MWRSFLGAVEATDAWNQIRKKQAQTQQANGFSCGQLQLELEEPDFKAVCGFRNPASLVHQTGGS